MQNNETVQGSDKQSYQTPPIMEVIPSATTQITSLETVEGTAVALVAHTWEDECEAFLNSAIDAVNTRRAYRRHLRNAAVILGVDSVSEVSGPALAAFRAEVTASKLATSSKGQAIAALRSFLTWSGDLGGHQLSPRVLKTALRSPKGGVAAHFNVVSEKEIAAMLSAARTPRELALLAVLVGSGLRVAEVSDLAVTDVLEDMDGQTSLHVRSGKGNKSRIVPIQDDVSRMIRSYLASSKRRLGGTGRLFLAEDRGAGTRAVEGLSTRAISRLVHELADAAGIEAKVLSPHSMRHSYAIRCLRSGGNSMAVMKLLGHSSLTTTQKYTDHLATSELRTTVPNLPLYGA